MRTGKQIEDDIWRMLGDSVLGLSLSGGVYKEGMRPRDSKLEDAVVIFSAGLPEEVQTGVVTINIYVPDRDFYGNGQLLEDLKRTTAIEEQAKNWVEGLTCDLSNYKFKLRHTITTDYEPKIHQHFVVVALGYEYYAGGEDELPLLETEEGDVVEVIPMQLKTPQSHVVEIQPKQSINI